MYQHASFLAIIPARGGSKGVPRKNIRPLAGKPLIAWTIDAAHQSRYLDRVILSSEDAEIIEVAKRFNCEVPFVRPAELAQDHSAGIDPILHAINTLPTRYDFTVILQPTSPLRSAEDIDQAIKHCIDNQADFCVSVTAPDKHPYWHFKIDTTGHLQPLFADIGSRRQDLPDCFALNGAVYVAKTSALLEHKSCITPTTLAYIMPKQRSQDIDTALDFGIAEYLLTTYKQ